MRPRALRAAGTTLRLGAIVLVGCGRSSLLDYDDIGFDSGGTTHRIGADATDADAHRGPDGSRAGLARDGTVDAESGDSSHSDAPDDALDAASVGDASDARRPDASFEAGCPVPASAPPGVAYWASEATAVGGSDMAGWLYESGLAVAPGGSVVVVGGFQGPITVGGTMLTTPADAYFEFEEQAFVAKYGPAGDLAFALAFPNESPSVALEGEQGALAVAIDSDGDIYVVGFFTGTIVFPGSPPGILTTTYPLEFVDDPGPEYGFVAKIDSRGHHRWSKGFGAPVNGTGTLIGAVALDPTNGDLLVAGDTSGPVNFSDAGQSFNAGVRSPFALRLTPFGDLVWSRIFSVTTYGDARGIAVDVGGNTFVVGTFEGSLGLGSPGSDAGASLTCSMDGGALCVPLGYVAKLDPQGIPLWAQPASSAPSTGSILNESGFQWIAVDGLGNASAVGWVHDESVNRDAGTSTDVVNDGLITQFDTNGNARWSVTIPRGGAASAGIASDAVGNLFVGALSANTLPIDGGSAVDSTLIKLSADGGILWTRSFQGGYWSAVAVDPCATELVVGGGVSGTLVLEAAHGGTFVLDAGPVNGEFQAAAVARLAP